MNLALFALYMEKITQKITQQYLRMHQYLIERDLHGRYSILDFHSRLPAEILREDGTVVQAVDLDPAGLGHAMADLYRELLIPDHFWNQPCQGIRFWRKRGLDDQTLDSLIAFSEGANDLYQAKPLPKPGMNPQPNPKSTVVTSLSYKLVLPIHSDRRRRIGTTWYGLPSSTQ